MDEQALEEGQHPQMGAVLATLKSQSHMDMAFGGRVDPTGSSYTITGLCGARTASLENFVVRSREGLGGKALALGKPVSVVNYHSAQGITHVYDRAVRPECLETVVAFPVFLNGVPRLVINLASRSQLALGDRWFDAVAPRIRKLEHEMAVDDGVRRRISALNARSKPGISQADLRDIAAELTEIADAVQDKALQARLERVRARLCRGPLVLAAGMAASLTPREIDVLVQVARGHSNQDAADSLGILPSTVKSYLKTAMSKLNAKNRVQAIIAARECGLIN